MYEIKTKKRITIVVPVFNEEACLAELYVRTATVRDALADYETELVFFDDGSTDASREIIQELCQKDSRCRAVLFAENHGYNKAVFYALQQAKGDCAVLLHADLQNPPELIPAFVQQWECGHDVVFGVKNRSRENKAMFFVRTLFYRLANLVFAMQLIPHATDFELVDKSVIERLRENDESEPILRIILRETAQSPVQLFYTQDKRAAGQSSFDLKKYFRLACSWITASRKRWRRRFLCAGALLLAAGAAALHVSLSKTLMPLTVAGILFIVLGAVLCFTFVAAASSAKRNAPLGGKALVEEDRRINY